jgi:DNA processing protein
MRPDDEERRARAAWSAMVEPGDLLAGALVRALGAAAAVEWVAGAARGAPDWTALPGLAGPSRMRLVAAARRWAARADDICVDDLLAELGRAGGSLVVPGDDAWPTALGDLGDAAPFALWCRGTLPHGRRAVAIVGSRASTGYGERVAFDLANGLVARGVAVVSGGAYGIDAAAHRGAIAGDGATLVVLAGGVDRGYPAGNMRLFEEAIGSGGGVASEMPPGALPTKSRFLQRNRLIAAITDATVVVEAAWRSGALSTAHHAVDLMRPVGAVPGPVTSVASAGCHRLLREGAAVCVTDVEEVVELLPGAPEPGDGPVTGAAGAAGLVGADDTSWLDQVCLKVHDALSLRTGTPEDVVPRRAGVGAEAARSALGLLELAGLAVRKDDGWRAVRPPRGRG